MSRSEWTFAAATAGLILPVLMLLGPGPNPASAAPAPSPARFAPPAGFRADDFDIALTPDGTPKGELEFKVAMQAGAALVYSWALDPSADPKQFYYDFHSEHVPNPNDKETSYRKGLGTASEAGALTAPFTGIHGWYFQNQSEKPMVIHLRLAGFYTLIPAGQDGNAAGILPVQAKK